MGHVGDVNSQLPVAGFRVAGDGDGVVEVAGVDRVDGDDQIGGEVVASVQVGFVERIGGGAGLLQRVVGELFRQVERADHRQRVDAWLAVRPEYLGEHPLAAVIGAGEAHHLEHHLVAAAGALGAGVANRDAMTEHGSVDAHQPLAIALEVSADELAGGSLQHAQHLA
ncbi:MAG: hypothetical protein U0736_07610 [Gemmataceae bacterium]